MDAIKKKMQAMKLEKDNAMDRADTCEQQARDANLRAEKVTKSSGSMIDDSNCYRRFLYATGRRGGARSPEEDAAA
jgi:hypothetical protein